MHITTKAVLGIGAIITVVGIVMFANGYRIFCIRISREISKVL